MPAAQRNIVVVMGVSGSGKSTLGSALALRLGVPFFEGDEFHPPENVARMRSGIALTDTERVPWIAAIAAAINPALAERSANDAGGVRAVLACSALTAAVRERLRNALILPCCWVHLYGDEALIQQRLERRQDHFMPPALLRSQFDALQIPADAIGLDIAAPLPRLLDAVLDALAPDRR